MDDDFRVRFGKNFPKGIEIADITDYGMHSFRYVCIVEQGRLGRRCQCKTG